MLISSTFEKTSKSCSGLSVDRSWPTHVRLPIDLEHLGLQQLSQSSLSDFIDRCHAKGIDMPDIKTESNLHISLSKPFTLSYLQIESFIAAFEREKSLLYSVSLDCIGMYSTFLNETQTKVFLVLKVEDRSHKLAKNIEIIDHILSSFGAPIFYENAIFHISVASFDLSDTHVAAVTDKWMPVPELPNKCSVVPTKFKDASIESSALALLTYGESDSDSEGATSDKVSIIRLPVFKTILLSIGNREHFIECGNK